MDPASKEKAVLQDEITNIINFLAIVIKTARLHDIDNQATLNVINNLLNILNPLLASETIALHMKDDDIYLNDIRIDFSMAHSGNFEMIVEDFRARELGEITFKDSLKEEDMKTFVGAFLKAVLSETPFKALEEDTRKIPNIEIEKYMTTKQSIPKLEKRRLVKKSYSNAITIIKTAFDKVASNENIKFARPRRAVETLVDQIFDEESLSYLLAMTSIKDYADYIYYHSVNVSILSMALGHNIGLPKRRLADLGLAALFHDIGTVEIPEEILNKTTELTESDWNSIKEHPLQGMMRLIKLKGIDDISLNLAISAYEHHINHDLSGYPAFRADTPTDLFSKIIAISDRYDAMTSARVYSRTPKAPDEALKIMLEGSNKELDPCLLKFFVRMIGKYPVGCIVMLDSNELGIVARNNADPEFTDRPMVLIITDGSGNRIENTVVDLTEKNEEGNFRKSIAKTLDPNKYVMNLSEYLLLTA